MFNRHFRLVLLIVALLMVNLFIFFNYSHDSYAQSSIPEWLDESAEEVEILILLKDQANTGMVAFWTRRSLPFFIEPELVQKEVRSEVVETLQKKADSSQRELIGYLDREVAAGKVLDFQSYYIINLVYARMAPDLVEAIMQRPEVDSVWPNDEIEFGLSQHSVVNDGTRNIAWNISHIGADSVWNNYGYDGSGVVIGFIDTGASWQHESLKSKYRGYNPDNPDLPDHRYNWFDPYYGRLSPDDSYGHGTAVTSIALGSDPDKQHQIGVAPGAQWIAARGLDDNGSGTYADLLLAMEFMLAPNPNADGSGEPNANMAPDIVSNSWGGQSACITIFKQAIQSWRSAGILPVFSAGNLGPGVGSIRLPANYAESFSVGAIDASNALPDFSSRGPGACDDFIKPDLVAPGVSIRYASANGGYGHATGTSMAVPHIAGVAALLKSADPALSVGQLERIMRETATPLSNSYYKSSPNYGFGYGLVNAVNAIESIALDLFNVVLVSSPTYVGTLSGAGSYSSGSEVTVLATPAFGYSFKSWKENDLVVSNDASYTFTISSDCHLVATFIKKHYSIVATIEPAGGGAVTGEGYYYHGDEVTLKAEAKMGYRFIGWEEQGISVSTFPAFHLIAEKDCCFNARFQQIELTDIAPRFIYFVNVDGLLARSDYRQAVDDYLSGDKALYAAIKEAFIASRLSGRLIYIEDVEGNFVDYAKALDNGKTYFEAALDPSMYGVDIIDSDLEMVVDSRLR